jgi:serine phosphatase RsbU (regulator of sigma subunit)/pSer/pThr/pTyr-binding forkhead associated (FHA) protein
MASLLPLKGAEQGQRVQLNDEKIVLGRNADCHVVIAGNSVSREHAYIWRSGGKFYIEDNKSRNGTYVNNQAVSQRTLLKENDKIKICDFLFSFHEDAPPPPPEPEPIEETTGTFKPEAAVSHVSSSLILETQPAEKLRLLLDITNNLSKTLELESLLPQIVDDLFLMFRQADRGFIILSEEGGRFIPKVIKTRRANTESTARFSRTIVKQAIETVQGFLSEDASSDRRIGLSESIIDFRIRSVMCAPLWSQDDKGFGVIQLDTQDRNKKFTEEDLNLLMGVARQASIALENVKLHNDLVARERLKRDLELARNVQRSFLPARLPQVAGYEFFAHYEAAQEVGGDYYDFLPLTPPRLGVLLGDVAGKGVPAALFMAKLSAEARFCMRTIDDPAAAVSALNDSLAQAGLMDRFVTLAAVVLDPSSHTVTVVNAGHMAPMIYRKSTGTLEDIITNELTGLPLGVLESNTYESCQARLEPGDCILVFSDGVTDAMSVNNVPFQMEGIQNAVVGGPSGARQVGERLVKAVKQHSAKRTYQHDDITLVCLGRVAES